MNQDAEVVAIFGKAARTIDANALFDVLENLGVAALVTDDEEPQSTVFQNFEGLVIDVGARVG